MPTLARPIPTGRDWLAQVFECRAVELGDVIRRQVVNVEREVGSAAFVDAVWRRGYRLIRTRACYVIVCEDGPLEIIC